MMFVIFAKYFNRFPQDVVACPFILFSMAFIHSARVSLVKPLILLNVIQGVLLKISEDFQNIFCNRHPLGFHQIPSGISLATPIIFLWMLERAPCFTASCELLSSLVNVRCTTTGAMSNCNQHHAHERAMYT